MVGDGGHPESIDVAQHQRRPVGRVETSNTTAATPGSMATVSSTPAVLLCRMSEHQRATRSCLCPPMVHELVSGHPDQPRHIHHAAGGDPPGTSFEHVLRQILGHPAITDPAGEIRIHVRHGAVVEVRDVARVPSGEGCRHLRSTHHCVHRCVVGVSAGPPREFPQKSEVPGRSGRSGGTQSSRTTLLGLRNPSDAKISWELSAVTGGIGGCKTM